MGMRPPYICCVVTIRVRLRGLVLNISTKTSLNVVHVVWQDLFAAVLSVLGSVIVVMTASEYQCVWYLFLFLFSFLPLSLPASSFPLPSLPSFLPPSFHSFFPPPLSSFPSHIYLLIYFRLKRTSPTAYCDCWEKCKCKALIPGSQQARAQLLTKLINETDLVTKPNAKGEHLLLFLAQMVARQSVEQCQHRPHRSSDSRSKTTKTKTLGVTATPLPEHDLEPPRFARKALEQMLQDWRAVKAMIMDGCKSLDTRYCRWFIHKLSKCTAPWRDHVNVVCVSIKTVKFLAKIVPYLASSADGSII